MQSGKMLGSSSAQRSYTSSNYTHAVRDMLDKGLNVVMQMVAVKNTAHGPVYSLSSNSDLTLDIISTCKRKKLDKPYMVAMVNPYMPFMQGQAQVEPNFFDVIINNEDLYFQPFATPRSAINSVDYRIGLLASTLIKDGGTLQVGIGSLADALVYCTKLRHKKNGDYLALLDVAQIPNKFQVIIKKVGAFSAFKEGLYAASEMFVEGFAHLFDADILKRKVYPDAQIQLLINDGIITESIPNNIIEILLGHEILDGFISKRQMLRLQKLGILQDDLKMFENHMQNAQGKKFETNLLVEKNIQAITKHCLGEKLKQGAVLHGAFFLGSRWFYQWLNDLSEKNHKLFQMTPVSQVNELYGGEALDRVQRVKARFINTCMKVDVLGAAASDTLDNNQVVSGVGGQYNFVAMAHALQDSRSILMVRSTHSGKNGVESNIVWKYSYCSIPRHLRDIVVTEYGIADLRGQSDEECIKRMICIADSRFQNKLIETAIKYKKLDSHWVVPKAFRHNTPASLDNQSKHLLPEYPFGSDFTQDELIIIKALKFLKFNTTNTYNKIKTVFKAYLNVSQKPDLSVYLQRMGLLQAKNFKEKFHKKLFEYALIQCL